MSPVPPVRREVVVSATPEVAFRVFTERIGSWWPLAELSVHGAEASVSFDGDQIVEVASDGRRSVWGSVTTWRPGELLAFTWHPGHTAHEASRVRVSFTDTNGSTLVSLVHDGWEVFADPAAARAEYDGGWPMVLGRYAADVPRAA